MEECEQWRGWVECASVRHTKAALRAAESNIAELDTSKQVCPAHWYLIIK
jgi:hypothetical protein